MTAITDSDRSRSRRERTFIGSECAACEEPLEHTLRGERVLQFSCGHVSHEACFYEYIREADSQYCPTCEAPLGLDTTRGGSILDIGRFLKALSVPSNINTGKGKLTNMVRSVANDPLTPRSSQNTPMPWDRQPAQEDHPSPRGSQMRENRDASTKRDSRDSQRLRIERLGIGQMPPQHSRNDSGNASSADYPAPDSAVSTRKHDYDLHAMETNVGNQQSNHPKKSLPAPLVTVRSEYPTMNRSRQQQSLTCLVTVEVPEAKWKPDLDDVRDSPSMPTSSHDHANAQAQGNWRRQANSTDSFETSEQLREVTEELRQRVENWHGLEFHRFGKLRLHSTIRVGKDRQSWQELECYLFAEMLICVKEKKGTQAQLIQTETGKKLTRCTLKGSILIKKHLRQVQSSPDDQVLTLDLSVNELPTFHLQFQARNELETWKRALLDLHNEPPAPLRSPQDYELDTSGTDDDDYGRPGRVNKRMSSVASSSYGGDKSNSTAPTEYTQSSRPIETRLSPSFHVPVDIVVVIPVSSSMQGLKITLLRDALKFLVQNLGERDRMGLVTFGSSGGGVPLVGMTTKSWAGWTKVLNSIKPVGQKSLRADVVEGANVAMDLLMQRKAANPISTILLISDSSTSDSDSVDFVVQRAEAAK